MTDVYLVALEHHLHHLLYLTHIGVVCRYDTKFLGGVGLNIITASAFSNFLGGHAPEQQAAVPAGKLIFHSGW